METLTYHLSLLLFTEEKCFGPGPMRLLRGVERTGSLQKSAEEMGMAYSKAWKMMKEMEKHLGFSLLLRYPGGKHGGGSVLTEKGRYFLEKYETMLQKIEDCGQKIFEETFDQEFFETINHF